MHPESYELMRKFAPKAACAELLLDIGALDVNGNLRDLFGPGYVGLDLVPGPNVDIVLSDPYQFPFMDGCADCIISANSFEHVARPWKLVLEIDRVLKPGGRIAITAPWVFPYHYPPDLWRMSPDAFFELFTSLMVDSGRKAYLVDHMFLNTEDPGAIGAFVDTYFEARKPQ